MQMGGFGGSVISSLIGCGYSGQEGETGHGVSGECPPQIGMPGLPKKFDGILLADSAQAESIHFALSDYLHHMSSQICSVDCDCGPDPLLQAGRL